MVQLEENLMFRLTRLEKMLEAYRKLHLGEFDELARGLADLRRDLERLAQDRPRYAQGTALESVFPHTVPTCDGGIDDHSPVEPVK